ncbi:MAG: tRNA (guanosine(46)-N7)-methyltransferase TrmB [Bacteroidota bacterium]
MPKRKLQRFAAIKTFPNVFQLNQTSPLPDVFAQKGKWHADVFGNTHPITLELGCGKAEYTLGMAKNRSNRNFVGVDLKGNRIYAGALQALQDELKQVAFLRTRIENLGHAFAPGEVDEVWITFPDPQPQKPRERKRLTNQRFLEIYRNILTPGGLMHLKTDHSGFWEYSLESLQEAGAQVLLSSPDVYRDYPRLAPQSPSYLIDIQTHYEKLFTAKGHRIAYVCARF